MKEDVAIANVNSSTELEGLLNNTEESTSTNEEKVDTGAQQEKTSEKKNNFAEGLTMADLENLFVNSESVGKEENKTTRKENAPTTSENPPYVLSSLAKTLKEEGIFSNLQDEDVNNIKSREDFLRVLEKDIRAQLSERQRRIDEALNYGVQPTEMQKYEKAIQGLESITDEQLEGEEKENENLRRQILYQDYVNKGFSEKRAEREVNRLISSGNDIEEAKEALVSLLEGMREQYKIKLDEARKQQEARENAVKEDASTLRKSILEGTSFLGDLDIDKATRQKVLDNIIKPIYKDPKTGYTYSSIQKYEMDNRLEFLKNLSLVYTLTDGFKNLDNLVQKRVKKEVNKSIDELERTLNNTRQTGDGSLNYLLDNIS